MENWSNWMYDTLGIGHSLQYKIITSIIVILAFYSLRRITIHFLRKKKGDIKAKYNWDKTLTYISYFFIIVIITPIWVRELQSFGTFLGLTAAGLAIALKDPISNFFAWIFIVIKQPFEMGDRIQIGNSEGDILNIGFFSFTMLEIKNWVEADQSTGRIIHVPNGLLFTQPVMNYNQAMDFIWNEIPIMITFESNWREAKKIFFEIEESKLKPLINNVAPEVENAQKKYYIDVTDINPTVYTKIKQNGVQLTLRYLCSPDLRRYSEQLAYEEILTHFKEHRDIQFAYPTTRFYTPEEKLF